MKLLSKMQVNSQVKSLYHELPKTIVCFSHLRWDFVFQRPQHLLTRFAQSFDIFFIEEPICDTAGQVYYTYLDRGEHLQVMVPHLPSGLNAAETMVQLKALFDQFMQSRNLADVAFWYYTPMALEFSRKYQPELVIYDCMDELSAFKFAPESLKAMEQELLKKADIVFTGGQSLYEAKKNQHANIYPFPSSIDKKHFEQARLLRRGQPATGNPATLGFYGVIDERFDIELIREIADARPHWQIMLIGPVVKIDHDTLPKNSNIHYLGSKDYQELPAQVAGWDVALIPFLLNESTRYISPTKTPEYLAAGVPVVSTPIMDVVNPYGKQKLVAIGSNAEDFIGAVEHWINHPAKKDWLKQVDAFLAEISWDNTCSRMLSQIRNTVTNRSLTSIAQ